MWREKAPMQPAKWENKWSFLSLKPLYIYAHLVFIASPFTCAFFSLVSFPNTCLSLVQVSLMHWSSQNISHFPKFHFKCTGTSFGTEEGNGRGLNLTQALHPTRQNICVADASNARGQSSLARWLCQLLIQLPSRSLQRLWLLVHSVVGVSCLTFCNFGSLH